ncbi:MAG: hypothetical protein ACR2MX_10075 [Cyclobacteriaceae bacterium]
MLATEPTQYFKGSLLLAIPGLAIIALLIWRRKLILVKWGRIEGGSSLRWIIGICAGLLAWAHVTFPFNYFLQEWFVLERGLMLVLAILVIWRPFFLLPYLLFPILIHFGEPVPFNNWSVTELPVRVLSLFCAQLIVWMVYGKSRWQIAPFVFLLLCIIAANYFPAGYGKLKLGWITKNHIYLLLPSMYADGWLGFLSQESLSEITAFASKLNVLLKTGTLVFEVGCIFMLWGKTKTISFFLMGFILFHTLVLSMTGIFFWPWMTFELTLLYLLWKKESFKSIIKKFTIWHFLLSSFLIGTSSKWLKPSVYVWHDSPVNYTYSFEVEDEFGKKSDLPSQFFWPKYYDYTLGNGFHFVHKNQTLPINWGVSTDRRVVKELLTSKTAEEVLALEKEFGTNPFKPELSEEFKRYLIQFATEKRYKLTMNPWFRAISAPPQRVIFPVTTADTYDGKNNISKIELYQKLSFFNGKDYQEIRKRKVLSIDIPIY